MTRYSKTLAAATLTSAFALVAYIPAHAADVYAGGGSLKDAPIIVAPTWTGFYIGANIGAAFSDNGDNRFKHDEKYLDTYSYEYGGAHEHFIYGDEFLFDDNDDSDFTGGIHLGYNWQKPGSAVVWGIEGDVSFADNIDYLASLRARLGFASDTSLIYLTAGVAFAEGDNGFRFGWKEGYEDYGDYYKLDDKSDNGDSETGWVIGGGAEFKLTPRVSFGVEGLYYSFDLDSKRRDLWYYPSGVDCLLGCADRERAGYFDSDDDFDFWQIRARLTFHTTGQYGPLP